MPFKIAEDGKGDYGGGCQTPSYVKIRNVEKQSKAKGGKHADENMNKIVDIYLKGGNYAEYRTHKGKKGQA